MRAVKVLLVCLITMSLIQWIGKGNDIALLRALPIIGGPKPLLYDLAGIAMFTVVLAAIQRMSRPEDEQDQDGDDFDEWE